MSARRVVTAGAFAFLALVLQLGLLTGPARAESASVRIRDAKLDPTGAVQLVVSVGGPLAGQTLAPGAFTVTEGGSPVAGLTAAPLLRSTEAPPVTVALVFDVSGSTAGKPLADAKAAGKRFLSLLPPGVRVAVIAFGPTAVVKQGFTSNRSSLRRSIDGLRASGGTALYDAVILASVTLDREQAQHNIVLFSDGKDTASTRRLRDAQAAARGAKAPVTSVGLVTSDFDAAALSALAGSTGGRLLSVGQSSKLADAFGQVARDIASQYVLTYSSGARDAKDLVLEVTASSGRVSASDAIAVLNPRIAPPPPADRVPSADRKPPIAAFANKTGLYVGIGSVFAALTLLMILLAGTTSTDPAIKVLRALNRKRGRRQDARGDEEERGLAASALGRRAVEIVDHLPKRAGYDGRVQLLLDRAGWPLRTSEFTIIQMLAAAGGLLLGAILLQRWWLGAVLLAAGVIVPRLVLARRVDRRRATFLGQLPDTLQLLAGSLQAGYGFMQGLDTLVKEAPAPTSLEFSRVLTESRLGMPVEDALMMMAERIDSDDFRWVVLAINIQRQVGGNLAVLLQTVAGTLREREQVRRQIKVLSAEGRLSGIILVSLPFGLAGYISVVNPTYIGALFKETLGRVMIAGALFMMGVGIAWMKKIINIDV